MRSQTSPSRRHVAKENHYKTFISSGPKFILSKELDHFNTNKIKMIFYWVFISYAFANALAVNINEYTTMIDITSKFIEAASNKRIDNETLNGFECTIRSIIRGKNYSYEEVLLLAIPDLDDQQTSKQLKRHMSFHKKLQDEIASVTGLAKPSATGGLTLKYLGDKIRLNTRKALWNLMFDDIMLPNYDSNNQAEDYADIQKCQTIGLALSCLNPLKYTQHVTFTHTTTEVLTCAIKDIQNNTRKYVELENEFWEVKNDDVKKPIGRLFDQIKMLLYCILISYVFMNVLAAKKVKDDPYTTMIDITSRHIEAAVNKKFENEPLNLGDRHLPKQLKRHMSFHKKLQDEISSVTGIPKPTAAGGSTLKDLGDKIRANTRKAIWNLLFHDIMSPQYESDNQAKDYPDIQKCQVVGLALSCIDPSTYTRQVSFTHTTTTVLTCFIKDINNKTRKYEESENEFWEIKYYGDVKKEIGRLFDQVEVVTQK